MRWFWGRWRNLPVWSRRAIQLSLIIVGAIVFDIVLLLLLSILITQQLLDLKTVLSFLAVEVLAAVILRLFGVGQGSEHEETFHRMQIALMKAEVIPKYAHLKIYAVEDDDSLGLDSDSLIINTKLDPPSAYKIPRYLAVLIEEDVIPVREFDTLDAMRITLDSEDIVTNNRLPTGEELGF
jgi:hypothetical protein